MSEHSEKALKGIFKSINGLVHEIEKDVIKIVEAIEKEEEHEVKCFAEGTLIRTVQGDVAVETLQVGDVVVTASGQRRPIRWLGHRRIDCSAAADLQWTLPIRIAKGAIDGTRPERDLLVSPGHALCIDVVDEVLIPAYCLVNGATVTQEQVAEVTYWHVELDSHDLLVANGMPAESYFEVGNRAFFVENETVAVHALPDARIDPANAYCRPLVDAGLALDAVRDRMRHTAGALGWTKAATTNARVHLLVDGVRVEPQAVGLANHFLVPVAAENVWIVSDVYVPFFVAHQDDHRRLGVCLGSVSIDDGFGPARVVALDHPCLTDGFHNLQAGPHRWTNGRARLPADLWKACRGDFFLRLDLAMASGQHWVAPPANVVHASLRAVA